MKINVDLVYPVGSIYMSVNSTSPGTLFGGTWTRIQGRFLLGAGSNSANTTTTYGSCSSGAINRSVNEQGGEVNHTLTINEMPNHSHTYWYDQTSGTDLTGLMAGVHNKYGYSTASTGGGAAHNNIPPYYVVYIWRRTA